MSKEDSTRTEATIAGQPTQASRDQDPDAVEVVEAVEIDQPEPDKREIETIINEDDDPRGAIYARYNEKREVEIAEQNAENGEIAVDDDGSEAIIESQGAQSTDTPPDSDPMVEVTISGVTRQVSKKKVDDAGGVENYQIRIAAQEQMERNAHAAREIEERKKALDEQERQFAAKQAEVPAMDPHKGQTPDDLPSDGQPLEDMAKQVLDAVYDGDENAPSTLIKTVESVVKRVVGESHSQDVDPDQIRQQVTEEVLQQQHYAKVVKARDSLFTATPQLNKADTRFDPRLFQAVDDETDIVAKQNPAWDPDQVINQAWTNVKSWKGGFQTETMTDKQEAKKEMNRPRTGSGRYKPPPPAPRQTDSDYVKSLRNERGLE